MRKCLFEVMKVIQIIFDPMATFLCQSLSNFAQILAENVASCSGLLNNKYKIKKQRFAVNAVFAVIAVKSFIVINFIQVQSSLRNATLIA